jgi:hypothetical protein
MSGALVPGIGAALWRPAVRDDVLLAIVTVDLS